MRKLFSLLLAAGLFLTAAYSTAQPPGGNGKGGGKGPGGKGGKTVSTEEMVNKLFAYDTNKDGKLSKSELTDQRLASLFDKADTNKDGYLTKEELTTFFTKEAASGQGQGGQSKGKGGGKGPPPKN